MSCLEHHNTLISKSKFYDQLCQRLALDKSVQIPTVYSLLSIADFVILTSYSISSGVMPAKTILIVIENVMIIKKPQKTIVHYSL